MYRINLDGTWPYLRQGGLEVQSRKSPMVPLMRFLLCARRKTSTPCGVIPPKGPDYHASGRMPPPHLRVGSAYATKCPNLCSRSKSWATQKPSFKNGWTQPLVWSALVWPGSVTPVPPLPRGVWLCQHWSDHFSLDTKQTLPLLESLVALMPQMTRSLLPHAGSSAGRHARLYTFHS